MVLAWLHTTTCTSCMSLPLVTFWLVVPSHSHWRWQLHCMVNIGIALTYVYNAAKCWKPKLHTVHKPWIPQDGECLMQCLPFYISTGVWFYAWCLKLKLKVRIIIHTSVKIIKSVDEDILDSHYNTSLNLVLEGSGILGCYAASLGKRFWSFQSVFSVVYSKETQNICYQHLQAVQLSAVHLWHVLIQANMPQPK